jgi:ParB family chromosome partitioning protein
MNYNYQNQSNSIFWIELDKIKPNPMQPRREFNNEQLQELADSIKTYGLLQPLVVVRKEQEIETGTKVEYELISGERRLRACKMAGILQAPVIIRKEPPEKIKLELALVENIQREDLNVVEKARAFKKLVEDFGMMHKDIAQKIGKSRVVVTNTIRILNLPEEIQRAIAEGRIHEGHARPLLMLQDRPEAQQMLYKDIIYRGFNVRQSEKAARRIAIERVRKLDDLPDPETRDMEKRISDVIGIPVSIIKQGPKGRIHIDFFSEEELKRFLSLITKAREKDLFQKEEVEKAKEEILDQRISDNFSAKEVVAKDEDLPMDGFLSR